MNFLYTYDFPERCTRERLRLHSRRNKSLLFQLRFLHSFSFCKPYAEFIADRKHIAILFFRTLCIRNTRAVILKLINTNIFWIFTCNTVTFNSKLIKKILNRLLYLLEKLCIYTFGSFIKVCII